MANMNGFNNTDFDAQLGPVPKGDYLVMITKSDVKENKAKTGKFLQLSAKILEGEFSGRYVNMNFNCWHPNIEAVEVAGRQLQSVCMACGFDPKRRLQDSVELHNIKFVLSVDVTDDGKYNEFKACNTLAAMATPAPEQADTPAPASAPAQASGEPW